MKLSSNEFGMPFNLDLFYYPPIECLFLAGDLYYTCAMYCMIFWYIVGRGRYYRTVGPTRK